MLGQPGLAGRRAAGGPGRDAVLGPPKHRAHRGRGEPDHLHPPDQHTSAGLRLLRRPARPQGPREPLGDA